LNVNSLIDVFKEGRSGEEQVLKLDVIKGKMGVKGMERG
jgi:hypothetical protein